jgi:hypothetical protein
MCASAFVTSACRVCLSVAYVCFVCIVRISVHNPQPRTVCTAYKQTHGTETQSRTVHTDLQENIQTLQHTSTSSEARHTHKFEICKYLNRCGLSYALMGPLRPTHRLWLPHGIQPTQRKRNGSSRTTCRRTLNLGCPVPASSRCGVCVYVCV